MQSRPSRILSLIAIALAAASGASIANDVAAALPACTATLPCVLLPTECSDGKDNDFDGRIDHPDDPGCDSPSDDTELSADRGIPGPLVLNVYWNGTGSDVEWVYQGSFDCSLVASSFHRFRVECIPLDPLFHCVNPGLAVVHSGPYGTRSGADLECGSIQGGCITPDTGPGACNAYLVGTELATVVCYGGWDFVVGGGGGEFPPRMHITCYSDPPALPRPPVRINVT